MRNSMPSVLQARRAGCLEQRDECGDDEARHEAEQEAELTLSLKLSAQLHVADDAVLAHLT